MTEIFSTYAQKVGALVLNLATRGLFVKIAADRSVISGITITMSVSIIKNSKTAVLREFISEHNVENMYDVGVIADAMHKQLLDEINTKAT